MLYCVLFQVNLERNFITFSYFYFSFYSFIFNTIGYKWFKHLQLYIVVFWIWLQIVFYLLGRGVIPPLILCRIGFYLCCFLFWIFFTVYPFFPFMYFLNFYSIKLILFISKKKTNDQKIRQFIILFSKIFAPYILIFFLCYSFFYIRFYFSYNTSFLYRKYVTSIYGF